MKTRRGIRHLLVLPRRVSDEYWDSGFGKSVAVYLNAQGIPDLDPRGRRVTDSSFTMCFNAHSEPIEFTLPPMEFGSAWQPVVDTATGPGKIAEAAAIKASDPVPVQARAMVVLRAQD